MFEQTFKNIDDVLRKVAGCGSEAGLTQANLLAVVSETSG